jgi:hypothetical protein
VVVTPEIPISELYKADTIKSKDGAVLVEYDAALPLVSGGSAKAITTINEYYKQEMQAFLTNAETELKTTAQLNYDNSKQSGNSFIPCNAHENYTVEYSKNGVLSIAREINFFFGSVNVDANVKSDTFDMLTGDRIVLDNIFSVGEDTYLPRLSGAVSAQIKKLGAVNAGYYDDYEQRAKDYLLKEDFYLTENGVVVYYPTITVAPEMLGVCRFEIPYADLNDILAERFK